MDFLSRGTLQSRLVTLVVVLGLLSLGLHLVVTGLFLEGFSRQFAGHMVSRAQLARVLLSSTPSAARDTVAAELRSKGTHVERQTAPVPPPFELPWPGGPLANLVEQTPPDMRVSLVQAPLTAAVAGRPTVQFAFQVDGEAWLLQQALTPPELAMASTLLGWPVLIALGVMGAMLLGVRMIGRPLQQTVGALTALGQGPQARLSPIAIPTRASREVVQLVQAFNALVHAVGLADVAKQQLLAGVSHDLRTPLTRLRLRIETQCEDMLGQQLSRHVYSDLDALERIVAQFLAYVQGQGVGGGLGQPQPMGPLVRQVVLGYSPQQVSLVEHAEDTPLAVPDLTLQRALSNLIDNALTHGQPPVVVELRGRSLTVWDAGPGIPEDDFAQALQPFVRLRSSEPATAQRSPASCGLGLAIVAQLAQHSGAQLRGRRAGPGQCVPPGCFGVELHW